MNIRKHKCLRTNFGDIPVYSLPMKVEDVVFIHYVAVRGKDNEEGAVQRILTRGRIDSIKQFVLNGNMFFNTFILNWTGEESKPVYDEGTGSISIPIYKSAAQVLDGQHRLAGLAEAMKVDSTIKEKEILVSICIGVSTKQAATIFLNINSEQKPVRKSLVYDLFGEIEDDRELPAIRALDIATALHDEEESPYYKLIKFPGTPRGQGTLDLSTVVSRLKRYLGTDDVFAKYNLRSLNYQTQTILNYLSAIRDFYGKIWSDRRKNPFLRSAGFNGAIDFLTSTLLMKCADKKSFEVDTFRKLLRLDQMPLLLQDAIKNLDGSAAPKEVIRYLEQNLLQDLPTQDDYKF